MQIRAFCFLSLHSHPQTLAIEAQCGFWYNADIKQQLGVLRCIDFLFHVMFWNRTGLRFLRELPAI